MCEINRFFGDTRRLAKDKCATDDYDEICKFLMKFDSYFLSSEITFWII